MKVIFVDDEIMILNGLKRAFFRNKWQNKFVSSATEALHILAKEPVDFIISDMRMPQMDGAELLKEVAILHPQIVRVILSGHSDEEAAKRASFVAHQWFDKPCKPQLLEQVLNNIDLIRNSLPSTAVQKSVCKIKTLPSPPQVYMRLRAVLNDNSLDMQKIAAIIGDDPALIAKILQLTNSSFFSTSKQVESLTEAITRLGIDLVCCIVITAETYAKFGASVGFSIVDEQKHSLATARLAATMVEPSLRQETILVGLLHNIGKFILAELSPELMGDYIAQRDVTEDNIALEQALFNVDHSQLAGYLLHLWNFSYRLIDNIILHRQPIRLMAHDFGSGAAVYVATSLLRKQPIDEAFIEHFNLADKLVVWQDKAIDY